MKEEKGAKPSPPTTATPEKTMKEEKGSQEPAEATTAPADAPMIKDKDNSTLEPTDTDSKKAPAVAAPTTDKNSIQLKQPCA